MRRLIAATVLSLVGCAAQACDALILHGLSYHTDRDLIPDVNEVNAGIGCELGNAEFGFYENSYSDVSAYLTATTHQQGIGVFVSIASNYHKDKGVGSHGIMPVVGLRYATENFVFRVAGPTYNTGNEDLGAVFAASYRVELP